MGSWSSLSHMYALSNDFNRFIENWATPYILSLAKFIGRLNSVNSCVSKSVLPIKSDLTLAIALGTVLSYETSLQSRD